jgi:hypothetical protein
MKTTRPKDGTLIAFDRVGDRRSIILVDGALSSNGGDRRFKLFEL